MHEDEFTEVNSCLRRFDVTMYRGDDGRCRIWGDINRIQDIIFSDCLALSPPRARADLDWFFAHEVDGMVASHLRAAGIGVDLAPREQLGIAFTGPGPSDEQMSQAFTATYDWFRSPPGHRAADT